ncbi:MAG: Fe-S cluster assembly sulfur transfer protein SufU [Opitutaceae bacterium]
MSDLDELYQQIILEHNRRPRNRGRMPTANRTAHGDNPSCGDQCTVFLRLDGDHIADIAFEGEGCAISQASASVMTTRLKGKTTAEAKSLFDEFHQIITTGQASDELNDLAAFAGVHAYPARIKCATLAWRAALDALREPPTSNIEYPTSKS